MWKNYLRPRHPVGPTVRLATWNLKEFSPGRKHIDLRTIAKIITDNQFDLVAIEEVKREGEEVDRLLNVLGPPWRSTMLSPMTGNSERFVFIYNGDHVTETTAGSHPIRSSDVSIFDRTPYQDSFKAGNFDFTMIAVHLSYTDVKRRHEEARALAQYAKELAARESEKDIIVTGDFNEMQPGTTGSNLHFFTAMGWESLNHDLTNLSSSETFDTFLIDPQFTREWNGTAASVHFDESLFGNDDKRAEDEISDHRPAYADFVTNLPDDD